MSPQASAIMSYSPVVIAPPSTRGASFGEPETSNTSTSTNPEASDAVVYRGGFATSICDLFQDPHDRTSCCALTCCGTFLQDRNLYLLTKETPPPWWARVVFYLGGLLLAAFVGAIQGLPILFIIAYVVVMMIRASSLRQKLRFVLKDRMEQGKGNSTEGAEGAEVTPDDSPTVHQCLACIHNDKIYRSTSAIMREDTTTTSNSSELDFCGQLWCCLRLTFFKACCDVYCNCCGVCATVQEAAQIKRLLPPSSFFLDYITFQPFGDYYPRIEQLRIEGNNNLLDHFGALSLLSKKLFNIMVGCLVLALAIAVLLVQSNKSLERVGLLVLTLGNAFAILYCVHWRNHRHDISLDAVIKLFASGFFLAVLTAISIEILLGMISGLILMIVLGVELTGDDGASQYMLSPKGTTPTRNDNALVHYAADHHWMTFVMFLFWKSFVEAALVEELAKYFAYFMVEHGDFIFAASASSTTCASSDVEEQNTTTPTATPTKTTTTTTGGGGGGGGEFVPRKALSPSATASAITVAMVATATGFSCSENLEYVFGQKSIASELIVLVLRALLPVHSLCAAIQSIGVVRRDVEKDPSSGLGWAILPAVILHGTFDFVLMMIGFVMFKHQDVETYPTSSSLFGDKQDQEEEEGTGLSAQDVFLALCPGLIIMALGVLYYNSHATAQRLRLALLDHNQPDIVISSPFL